MTAFSDPEVMAALQDGTLCNIYLISLFVYAYLLAMFRLECKELSTLSL